jgi:SAM-dependent methyltransferase
MERSEVLGVYNEEYAAAYNERYLFSPWAKHGVDYEITILQDLLDDPDARWLDVGCGTGWVLSQFPEVARAGLDLSPDMLAQAKAANPDALFFRQGDFTHDVEEFHSDWSVVSCMWMAYCYLATMPECEALVANMARWTRPGGAVFIPSVIDLEDLRPHVQVAYEEYPEVWGGRIAVTGHNWTWEEPDGNVNANMMAPHVGHFVRLLEPHFERVEVIRYPRFMPGYVPRKAVLATGRRPVGETGEAEVIWHPVPGEDTLPQPVTGAPAPQPAGGVDVADLQAQLDGLRNELTALRAQVSVVNDHLIRPGADDGTGYDIVGVVHEQVSGIRRELAELSERLFPPDSPGAAGATGATPASRTPAARAKLLARRLTGR